MLWKDSTPMVECEGVKKERHNPNPKGKEGNPITLAPMSFEDAVRKMLGTQPPKDEPKETKPGKQPASRKR
jgi:hypothetical protein